MAKNITGTNRNGKTITLTIGDRIRFVRPDNVVVEDVVRDCFTHHDTLGDCYPAVVLTEHSWTPLSSCLEVVVVDPKSVQMRRTLTIEGVQVSFRRTIMGWVACFGPGYCVHFRQPIKGGVWVARRPMALENICAAPTLTEAVQKVKAHYDALCRESAVRIAARVQAAAAELANV